jgi:hypothetical protein
MKSLTFSQKITNDSITCIPNKQLKRAIKDIEIGKICKEELITMKESINILNQRLDNQNLIIVELKSKSALQDSVIAKFEENKLNYEKVISNNDKSVKILKRKLSWNKGLKFIYAAGGFIISLLIFK